MVVGLTPAQGDFTLPDRRDRDHLAPHQRRQRHHPGAVDAAHPRATRATTARSPSSTTPSPPADALYADELAVLAGATPDVRLVRVFTDEPGVGDLDGFFCRRAARRGRPRLARPPRPTSAARPRSWTRPARSTTTPGCADRAPHRGASPCRQFLGRAPATRHPPLRRLRPRPAPTTGAPCSIQAEAAGLRPALGLPHGHLPHLHPHPPVRHRPQRRHRRAHRTKPTSRPHLRERRPSATSTSTSDPRFDAVRPAQEPADDHHDHHPAAVTDRRGLRPHPGAARRASARELDAIRDRILADLGEEDVAYIRRMIRCAARPRDRRAGRAVPRLAAAVLAGRHRRSRRLQDPRQHGDRPQRHARPVRLHPRPGAARPRASSGTPPAPATSGATPTTTCTTPSPTSSARTATSATASCA